METRAYLTRSGTYPQHLRCVSGPSIWQLFRYCQTITMTTLRLLPPEWTTCVLKWTYPVLEGNLMLTSALYLLSTKVKHNRVMFKAVSHHCPGRYAGCLCWFRHQWALASQPTWCPAVCSIQKGWLCGSLPPSLDPSITQLCGSCLSSLQLEASSLALVPWLVASSGEDGIAGRVDQGCYRKTIRPGCESFHCADDLPLNLPKGSTQNKIMLLLCTWQAWEYSWGALNLLWCCIRPHFQPSNTACSYLGYH